MSEQQTTEMINDYFCRLVAFMPIANELRINVLLTLVSQWAQMTNHDLILKAIEENNIEVI